VRTLLVLIAVALAGCIDIGEAFVYEPAFEGGGGGGGAVTFEQVQRIFDQSCAFAGCHSPDAPGNDLFLDAANSFEELLGPDGEGGVAASHPECRGLDLVVPGAPGASCLGILVDEGLMPPGDLMPRQQRDLILAWIAEGARGPGEGAGGGQ